MTKAGVASTFFFNALHSECEECVFWPFRRNNRGYAEISLPGYKTKLAHRIMCHIANGEPPSVKHHASHSCGRGVDGCINPKHLLWKTPVENARDKFIHGTQLFGEIHQNAVLNTAQAMEIKYSTEPRSVLSKRYDTSVENVRDIQNGRRWRHLK